jgi:uncharacterized protein
VDSTLLAALALRELGGRALAVTARGEIFPRLEARRAAELAGRMGIRHRFLDVAPLSVEGVRRNPPDRCYHCKRTVFGRLVEMAAAEGLAAVLDGQNVDDAGDYRPGERAAAELGVISPLREAGLGKSAIRQELRRLGLPNWSEPSMACLASRVPYGQELAAARLRRIDSAEEFLRDLGLAQVRVRDSGETARIEVPAEDVALLAAELRERVVRRLKALGYRYVSVDLEGYRTGSMNEGLGKGG